MPSEKTLDVKNIISRDNLAAQIAEQYSFMKGIRKGWEDEKKELRDFVFATDTTTTSNSKLPWKNKTTLPKLCQIRDNLHANYMAALFPNDNWFKWEAANRDAAAKEKRKAIETYMRTKVKDSGFRSTVSQLVYDFIDYGNAIADVVYVEEKHTTPDGDEVTGYVGPKLVRISPLDIVFDITASEFDNSPKITRYVTTLGEIAKQVKTKPELGYREEILNKARETRNELNYFDAADIQKGAGFNVDGFGSLQDYYRSGMIELLEFEGDLYDQETGELYENHIITIVDRSYILRMEPQPSWLGKSTKKHVGWRLRPDNLMAMGPLDNLVGMQYRIDHLENLKADVFDLIAHPPLKIRGYVEDFEWEPNARIYMAEDADVEQLRPDTTALNADMQIRELENKMEELAGAPRQAMGIRTPGEKTAYEVQTLENAASRIFQNKITYFEEMFLEPLLNTMLEMGKRNLNGNDIGRTMDDDYGIQEFLNISKEDITASGKLRPIAARHFAEKAQLVQNLNNFANSALGQDRAVISHISGKKIAQLMEEMLGVERFELVKDNIRITEEFETQQLVNAMQQQLQVEDMTPTEGIDEVPQA